LNILNIPQFGVKLRYWQNIPECDGFHMFDVMYFIAYSICLYYPYQQIQINVVINNRGDLNMRHVFRLMFILPAFIMIFLINISFSAQNQKIVLVKGERHG